VADRLKAKTAIIVGAGQTPGETIGNGRATALLFAREGAEVLCIDRDIARAEETVSLIAREGGRASAFEADISQHAEVAEAIAAAAARWPRIDILYNNVGIGRSRAGVPDSDAWDRLMAVNLKAMWMTIEAVLPVMKAQGGGAIVNVSSTASLPGSSALIYGISKAGVNRLTVGVALATAAYGIRCNAVLPGAMDTPMAVEGIAATSGRSRDAVRQARDARVPLRARQGSGWDTAYASLFLASDEAAFITGVLLVVDGGGSLRRG
jgi:NAD(P)-dependent dehydrogenase (short-subunit alcohol dehydrogenase family)